MAQEAPVIAAPLREMAPVQLGALQNTDKQFDLSDAITVFGSESFECLPSLLDGPHPANAGTVWMNPDCTFLWQVGNGAYNGDVTFTYRVCDNHPLLEAGDHGPAAKPHQPYADGDLDADTSRRCMDGDATISITAGGVLPPFGVKDSDVVDAGDAGDAIGPYSVEVPVLANDFDPNGPAPTEGLAVLDKPDPGEGTAEVVGDVIRFTPADGFSGPVTMTYRVCEDPDLQNPPYEGFGFCGVGSLVVDVPSGGAGLSYGTVAIGTGGSSTPSR